MIRDLHDGDDLEKGRANLKERWQSPTPVIRDLYGLDRNSGSKDGSDKVR